MARFSVSVLLLVPCVWLVQCAVASPNGIVRGMHNLREIRADSDKCTRQGKTCSSSCSELIDCYVVDGQFYSTDQVCDGGEKCDPYSTKCSSSATTCPTFVCGGEGLFPDITDCATFHVCDSDGNDEPGSCKENYAYDASTQDCVEIVKKPSLCTGTPVPQCKSKTQSDSLKSNPSIYYKCDSGQPQLYYCEGKNQFNPDTGECADASLACGPGAGTYPDVNDCTRYYTCTEHGKFPSHGHCAGTEHYDPVSKQCIDGPCTAESSTTPECIHGTCTSLPSSTEK